MAPGGRGERRELGAEVGAGGGMGAQGTIDPWRSWVEEAEEAEEGGEGGSRVGGRGRRWQRSTSGVLSRMFDPTEAHTKRVLIH